MHNFTIVPASMNAEIIEITTFDESAVLTAAQRLGCQDAAVFEGGIYRYSLRLTSAGGWSIFQQRGPVPTMRQAQA